MLQHLHFHRLKLCRLRHFPMHRRHRHRQIVNFQNYCLRHYLAQKFLHRQSRRYQMNQRLLLTLQTNRLQQECYYFPLHRHLLKQR
jgi:hypothetical protein